MPAKLNQKSQYAPFNDCPELMQEFLSYILTIRGLSARTVDGYYIELRTFVRFLTLYRANKIDENNFDLEEFKKLSIKNASKELICSVVLTDIYQYLNFTHSHLGNAQNARARKISALNSFYKYLTTKTLHLKENPLQNLDNPKPKKSIPKHLTLNESSKLLQVSNSSENARDYCMLTLFLNCGMRLSELLSINVADIRDDSSLTLLGKGNKERVIYLNNACIAAIKAYLAETEGEKRQDDALFIGHKGKRLSQRRVQQLIEKSLKAAGLGGMGYTPHKLRHTAATLMYHYGNVDVRVLKEILGHENLNTTEIYTHVSSHQIENAAASSPLANESPSFGKEKEKAKEDEEDNQQQEETEE